MNTKQETTNPSAAADFPQPAPTPTPETVVDQLRAVQIGDVTPLTAAERRKLRRRTITSNPILQASINVLGALDNVSQAVGKPADQLRQLNEEAHRWTAVEDELRKMLSGVAGANIIRRQRVSLIAAPGLQHRIGTGQRPSQRHPRASRAGDQAIEELQPAEEGGAAGGDSGTAGSRDLRQSEGVNV